MCILGTLGIMNDGTEHCFPRVIITVCITLDTCGIMNDCIEQCILRVIITVYILGTFGIMND